MVDGRLTRALGWLFIAWVFLSARPLTAEPFPSSKVPDYAPGEVLVRVRPDVQPSSFQTWFKENEVQLRKELLPGLYVLQVPEGRERATAQTLAAHPAVMAASPNYLITQPANIAAQFAKPIQAPSAFRPQPVQTSGCVITDTLHMSLTPGGPPLPEDTLPSGSSEVYVVFDYEECVQQRVRVQVYWVDQVPPEIVNTQTAVLDGSDVSSLPVPAWEYFAEEGVFPIGQYLTLLQMPPDEAPNSGWSPVASDAWHVSTRPNDYWFLSRSNYQWPLHNTGHWGTPDADIDAPEAWDITTGWDEVTIAIVSTGVAMNHEDLVNKIWVNEDEIPGNGLDDDGNGYVDDVHGYDFAGDDLNDAANEDADPSDQIGYGTFAAGIAAAEANNEVGIAGVSWNARIMPVKVLGPYWAGGNLYIAGYLDDLIAGLRYAVDNGARVIYASPEATRVDPAAVGMLREAIRYAVNHGALVIVPAGDHGDNLCQYPTCFPEVLSVGATNARDQLWPQSSWGTFLDLVAPGAQILSTCQPGLPFSCSPDGYVISWSTQWAAAHVAGAAALVWSVNPDRTPDQVREALERSADDLGAPDKDDRYGYGRLNIGRAVRERPHKLTLQPTELQFLVHEGATEACRTLSNRTMGSFAWGATSGVSWLTVKGPFGLHPPSWIEVCIQPDQLADYTVYEAPLQVYDRFDPSATVIVPVHVSRLQTMWRAFLPLVVRRGPTP